MKFVSFIFYVISGSALAAVIQYSFAFSQVKYPILVTVVLMFITGFLSSRYNKFKHKSLIVYLLLSFFFLAIQAYGLWINYDGLKYLSPTLIAVSLPSFLVGFTFKNYRSAISSAMSMGLLLAAIFLAFFAIPKLEFEGRIKDVKRLFPQQYTLLQSDGKPLKIDKGKILFISFWDSQCKYCFKKLPYVSELKNKVNNKKVLFLEVNTGHIDTFDKFKIAVSKYGFPSELNPVYDQNSQLSNQVKIEGVPRQFIVKDNIILYDITGFTTKDSNFFVDYNRSFIERIL